MEDLPYVPGGIWMNKYFAMCKVLFSDEKTIPIAMCKVLFSDAKTIPNWEDNINKAFFLVQQNNITMQSFRWIECQ